MLVLETVLRIRREHASGKAIKAIARDLHLSRKVVRKAIRAPEADMGYRREVQPLPKLGPFQARLDALLEEDEARPRREKLRLTRIHDLLLREGFDGSYDAVRRYAARWRQARRRDVMDAPAFIPLLFRPGEAYQFDWSHEDVEISGKPMRVKVAHVRLCASRAMYVRAYVVIKAADAFHTKTTRPNEMWQTDFTYFKIIGWGWMYLSTVLDDFSRYIIAWRLCTNMRAEDVTDTLDLALAVSGCDSATVLHKPRLLSDNGPSYIAGELAEYIEARKMSHVRGAPMHPQTQGKIERWHQTLKNRILLENYFLPGDLEAQIEAFVEHYNHQRYHESLNNVTPADAYFGRVAAIIKQRERIKRQSIENRRLQHRKLAA